MVATANVALLSCEARDWKSSLAQAPNWTLHEVIRPE